MDTFFESVFSFPSMQLETVNLIVATMTSAAGLPVIGMFLFVRFVFFFSFKLMNNNHSVIHWSIVYLLFINCLSLFFHYLSVVYPLFICSWLFIHCLSLVYRYPSVLYEKPPARSGRRPETEADWP